jgi:natural product precursor
MKKFQKKSAKTALKNLSINQLDKKQLSALTGGCGRIIIRGIVPLPDISI